MTQLKTLEEALVEAQGGSIDLAIGYSILKDIFKRQNFEVKSASYVGKQKAQFIYRDPESKDPDKLRNAQIKFLFNDVSKDEFEKIEKDFKRSADLSFTSNKYIDFLKVMAEKNKMPKSKENQASRIILYKESQFVGKEANYVYVVEIFDKEKVEYVAAYKMTIIATK